MLPTNNSKHGYGGGVTSLNITNKVHDYDHRYPCINQHIIGKQSQQKQRKLLVFMYFILFCFLLYVGIYAELNKYQQKMYHKKNTYINKGINR